MRYTHHLLAAWLVCHAGASANPPLVPVTYSCTTCGAKQAAPTPQVVAPAPMAAPVHGTSCSACSDACYSCQPTCYTCPLTRVHECLRSIRWNFCAKCNLPQGYLIPRPGCGFGCSTCATPCTTCAPACSSCAPSCKSCAFPCLSCPVQCETCAPCSSCAAPGCTSCDCAPPCWASNCFGHRLFKCCTTNYGTSGYCTPPCCGSFHHGTTGYCAPSCGSCASCGNGSCPSSIAVPAPENVAPAPLPATVPEATQSFITPYNPVKHAPLVRTASQSGEPPLANVRRASDNELHMPPLEPQTTLVSRNVPVVNRPIVTIEFQTPELISLSPELAGRVGHAGDYSWVTGQLRKIGEQWLIVFAPDDANDAFGGRFILAGQSNIARYREGDLVSVRGQVTPARENSDSPAIYRAESIESKQR